MEEIHAIKAKVQLCSASTPLPLYTDVKKDFDLLFIMGGKNKGEKKQVDPAWNHCDKVGDGNKLKCKHCNNSYSCSVTRLKNHLAKTGYNITPCENVPNDIRDFFKQRLRESKKKKDDVEEGESSKKGKSGPRDISYGYGYRDEVSSNDEVRGGDEGYIGSDADLLNQGAMDQIRPGLGVQAQKTFPQNTSQFQFLPQQHQQLLSKDGRSIANDGSIGSPMQSTSSKNNRKRKGPSSSGAANSTGMGNTVGPSPKSQPSTPSTNTPGDGVAMANNLQNVSGTLKQNPEHATEPSKGSLWSHVNENGMDELKDSVSSMSGFSFNEVSSIRKSTNKVKCCHFSSDGTLLASSGHDKKVVLWNMDTQKTKSTPAYHTQTITDVCFRPNSTQLATSSYDTTIRLWDAGNPSYSIGEYKGHTSNVMSLDFHPKKTDLFCSCDNNNEMCYWSITQDDPIRVSKGGSGKVRFQPRIGQYVAATSGSIVSIYDVEDGSRRDSWQGHSRDISCLSWDTNGELLASVSEDSVRVWSLKSGGLIHVFNSSGNSFYSCVFHPLYPNLLVIGGYETLELWNLRENKYLSIQAHECEITAMAMSPAIRMVASGSYDKSVKIWK